MGQLLLTHWLQLTITLQVTTANEPGNMQIFQPALNTVSHHTVTSQPQLSTDICQVTEKVCEKICVLQKASWPLFSGLE